MDDIEKLVAETFKHFQENFQEEVAEEVEASSLEEVYEGYPDGPGVIYHIQKSTSIFVIRTLVSTNIKMDYQKITLRPEDYPSLRLVENNSPLAAEKLRFFPVENQNQAEIIHDQLNNRRFPMQEEMLCNLSDPGFSWWLTKRENSFQLAFTLSINESEESVKLGPLGDHQLALRNFQSFENLLRSSGLDLNIENEANRVQFGNGESLFIEELQDLFEFGVVGEGLTDIFRILAKRCKEQSLIETTWFYLHELAAMRRFWIQIQYDLNI